VALTAESAEPEPQQEPLLPEPILALLLEPVLPLELVRAVPEQAQQPVDWAARALLPAVSQIVRVVRRYCQQPWTAKTSCSRR